MVHPVMKAKRDPDSSSPEKSQIDPAELVHNEFVDESTFIAALMICAVQVQKEEGVEKHPIEKVKQKLLDFAHLSKILDCLYVGYDEQFARSQSLP